MVDVVRHLRLIEVAVVIQELIEVDVAAVAAIGLGGHVNAVSLHILLADHQVEREATL